MAQIGQPNDSSNHPTAGYERSDLKPGNIALFAAALAITITLVLVASHWLFKFAMVQQAEPQRSPSPLASTRGPIPGPLLQVHASKDLQEMRAAEDGVLKSYGWIDRKAGVVRIPVDRAIELLAERGLPLRPQGSLQEVKK